MPYASYEDSVDCLDPKRLGNQIYREAKTLVSGKWPNHPVSKMWINYRYSLCDYAIAGLFELKRRGRDYPHWFKWFSDMQQTFENTGKPSFVGNEAFHESHRSNLLRKNKEYYSQFNWQVPDDLPYIWPTKG